MAEPLTMYTTQWCAFCRRLKSQLATDGIEIVEVDIEADPDGCGLCHGRERRLPDRADDRLPGRQRADQPVFGRCPGPSERAGCPLMSEHRSQTATRKPASAPPGSGRPMSARPARAPGRRPEAAVLRRTPDGWRVGADDLPDLTCAMVLADLFAAELAIDRVQRHAAPDDPRRRAAPDPAAAGKRRMRRRRMSRPPMRRGGCGPPSASCSTL